MRIGHARRRNYMGTLAVGGLGTLGSAFIRLGGKMPFGSLKGHALAQFVSIAPEVSRSRGESLFLEGENPKHVLVICSGRVKLSVSSREGKTAILHIAGPGEILGLSSAMSGTPHETSAEAVELCHFKLIRVSDFMRFLAEFPEAAAEATACLLRDYRVVLNNVCRLALPNTVARRVRALLLC